VGDAWFFCPSPSKVSIETSCATLLIIFCERNLSTYSFIHSLKRNKLDPKRVEDLVYVHTNLRLLTRKNEEYNQGNNKMWDISGDT